MRTILRRPLGVIAITAAAAVVGGLAFATERPAVIGGIDDAGDASVVLVHVMTADGSDYHCSGVVVGPHTILSNASCVGFLQTKGTLQVFTGADFPSAAPGTQEVAVAEEHADPGLRPDHPDSGNDIDVLVTADALFAPPARLVPGRLPATAAGGRARLVGYGPSTLTDLNATSETRRQGTVTVQSLGVYSLQVSDLTVGACQGDTGAPLFMNLDGSESVVAIESPESGCTPASGSQATRIDSEIGFLAPYLAADGVVLETPDMATAQPPMQHGGCATSGAPTGGAAALVIAALVIALQLVRAARRDEHDPR